MVASSSGWFGQNNTIVCVCVHPMQEEEKKEKFDLPRGLKNSNFLHPQVLLNSSIYIIFNFIRVNLSITVMFGHHFCLVMLDYTIFFFSACLWFFINWFWWLFSYFVDDVSGVWVLIAKFLMSRSIVNCRGAGTLLIEDSLPFFNFFLLRCAGRVTGGG